MIPARQNEAAMDAAREEYLAKLRQLAANCRSFDQEPAAADAHRFSPPQPQTNQLMLLAEALERLEEEVNEIRNAQHSGNGATAALERRMAALEQSTPTPQSWRDLIQGIRNIRDLVALQAQQPHGQQLRSRGAAAND
jgi:hypothetical protein